MLISKVTQKAQTTLPSGVRKALGIGPGDQLAYEINGDQAVIRKVVDESEDPALLPFLAMLERDIARNAHRLVAVPHSLIERIRTLTEGVRVHHDEPIKGPVSL